MDLKKELSFFEVFSIAAGSMISSGLFVLPGIAYGKAGPAAVLSYFLAGILMLPTIFVQSELSTAMPKAGGTYFYINRILGTPMGFIAGFSNWFSIAFKSAFALIGIGAFALILYPHFSELQIKLIASLFAIFFILLNLRSTKHSGRLQSVLVTALLLIITIFVIRGYPAVHPEHFHYFMRKGWGGILATTGMVFISFGGLTKIASMAEEIKNPAVNLPKAMFWAFSVVVFLYVTAVTVIVGTLPHQALITTLTPMSDAARTFSGAPGLILTAVSALLAFVTTANAGIMSASRSPLAMSRDGLLPERFGRLSARHGTPSAAIAVTGIFILLMLMGLHIEELVKVASAFMLLLFVLVNLSLIVIRYSKLRNYRPTFKAPFFPYLNIAAILTYMFLIVSMGKKTVFIMCVFILLSVIWYFLYIKKGICSKSALLHLVERSIDRRLVTENPVELEDELLTILQQRDDISEDRFDRLVKECVLLDIDKIMGRDEFFSYLSKQLSHTLKMAADDIYRSFVDRETGSSTNIVDGIAIPHIIIPGTDKFNLILARSRPGIIWDENAEPVKAVFALFGTADQRAYHLRALMAIAQIVQDREFAVKWLSANDMEDLRSILRLMPRNRDNT